VITVLTAGRRDIRLIALRRSALSELRRGGGQSLRAVWTPDGRELIYTVESPSYNLFRMPIDGSAPERRVLESTRDKFAASVSPNGELLASEEVWIGSSKIVLTRLAGSGPTPRFGDSLIRTMEPAFSPDGRWIAYTGEVSGPTEVFIRAADGSGGRRQVSAGGGETPRWTRGGREIVYRQGDAFFAVAIDPRSGDAGTPVMLFRGRYRAGKSYAGYNDYDVTADGARFLVVKPTSDAGAQPVVVTLNWFAELEQTSARR
jgi:Tol biopolymer transport system component